jgi:hypothetical protein
MPLKTSEKTACHSLRCKGGGEIIKKGLPIYSLF